MESGGIFGGEVDDAWFFDAFEVSVAEAYGAIVGAGVEGDLFIEGHGSGDDDGEAVEGAEGGLGADLAVGEEL